MSHTSTTRQASAGTNGGGNGFARADASRSRGRSPSTNNGASRNGASRNGNGTATSAPSAVSHGVLASYYRDRYAELVAYAMKLVRDRSLAEDMIQQAFTNTVAAVRDGRRIDEEDLSAWLHRCIRNLSIDHSRGLPAEPLESVPEEYDARLPATTHGPVELAELRENWRLVTQAVDVLPTHFRDAFLLAELRGLTYAEIAAVLDRSVHSIRQILCRARRHVREIAAR